MAAGARVGGTAAGQGVERIGSRSRSRRCWQQEQKEEVGAAGAGVEGRGIMSRSRR